MKRSTKIITRTYKPAQPLKNQKNSTYTEYRRLSLRIKRLQEAYHLHGETFQLYLLKSYQNQRNYLIETT
jgi:hypothetical protein